MSKQNPKEKFDLALMDRERAALQEVWADHVWMSIEKLRGRVFDGQNATEAAAHTAAHRVARAIAQDAVWAVTEVHSARSWKYVGQRYFSQDAKARFEDKESYFRRGRISVSKFAHGLQLEHVIARSFLEKKLFEAKAPDDVKRILESATSCVVSKDEHRRLPRGTEGGGWGRYLNPKSGPPIAVWQRADNGWQQVDLRSFASG